jgi:hypothetical protein
MVCKATHSWSINVSASLVAFFLVFACVLSCTRRDNPSWWGQLVCTRVGNYRSRGVVIARLRSSVRSLLHHCQDLHQSIYLYLSEDRKPISHHQFFSQANYWSSGGKATLCWRQATRLTGPIYQHAIGTFNTCSWGPTHRSLTNTGGGYNLGGADFSHSTPRPFQPTVSAFHLRAPSILQFNQLY